MTRQPKHCRRIVLFVGILSVVALLVGFGGWKYEYPYGNRGCTLRCMWSSLNNYANDHNGQYPKSEVDGYAALQQLYPEYCPSAWELAGVSGDAHRVARVLEMGGKIDGTVTSWIYVPGLRQDDDQRLAILWESKAGLYASGKRNPSGGRAVLLVGSDITNVSAANWTNFLAEQGTLRRSAFQKPNAGRNQ
jgi:hypothetical protein